MLFRKFNNSDIHGILSYFSYLYFNFTLTLVVKCILADYIMVNSHGRPNITD